jgi:hypothetical protein
MKMGTTLERERDAGIWRKMLIPTHFKSQFLI